MKHLARILAVVMLIGIVAGAAASCGASNSTTYTLNESMGASPLTWNPHTWETNADSYISSYCEMALVEPILAEDGVNFEWCYEMATAVEDITATFADKAKWNIDGDANRVYKITLNPDAEWADGTKINADTYMYSMKALLDPAMQNYRANTYYSGASAILNADKYFKSGLPIYDPVVPAYGEGEDPDLSFDITKNDVYLHLTTESMTVSSYSFKTLCEEYGFVKAEDYQKLAETANAYGYVKVTDANKDVVKSAVSGYLSGFGLEFSEDLYKEFLFYDTGKKSDAYDFANVGLLKTGEYELTYITAAEVDMFNFLTSMTSNWIVYEELYEAGKDATGELVTTNYGTSVDTYMSYGPYKLASFETDKQIVMERNENWYGYSDGKHKDQYQTTHIKCDIIASHATVLQLFNQGKLDGVTLDSDDLTTYRMSDFLLKTDTTYTFRYIFASDLEKLAALEKNKDENKRVLYYDDFRKAISLAIDRTTFAQQATAGYKPAYALFNSLYYYDISNNPESIYRNTTEAKQAILDLYGIKYGEGTDYKTIDDAINAVTGYDVEEAKALFQAVYDKAIADKNYTKGQKVVINCMASAATELTPDDLKQEQLLNEFITAATKGTGFEGLVSVVFQCGASNRYEDVANGKVEMIRGAWGGAAFYPFSTIRCYTEPDYMGGLDLIHESCGWNPSIEKLEINVDINGDGKAEKTTKTLQDWAKLINGGIQNADGSTKEAAITDPDAQMVIFAALENAVLKSYQCIPFAAETACDLYSMQIKYATLNYNIMYGYGGIRFMTYNYSDAEWDAFVAEQGGTLSYE